MSNKFDNFPEVPDIDAESKDKAENQSKYTVIRSEDFKKLIDQIKKQNKSKKKLKKRIRKINKKLSSDDRLSESKKDEDKKSKTDNNTNATPKKEKSFWGKLGDTILKALPSILITVATTISALLMGCTPKQSGKLGKAVA